MATKPENIAGKYPAAIATYRLINKPTGHYYVGSTNNLARRLNRHRCDLQSGTHHSTKLQKQFVGWESIEVVFTVHQTPESALEHEQSEIDDHYIDPLCCNVATGVTGFWTGSHGRPPEITERIAAANRGRKHDDAFREKCRQRMLGTTMSADQKQKISDALYGRTISDATRQRLSVALKGKRLGIKIGPEAAKKAHQTKIKNGTLGHTTESKAKIAEANYKPVVIEGVEYPSIQDAAEQLGYGRCTVTYRINSPSHRFKDWCWKA